MTRSRYQFGDDHAPHFMTSTIVAWLPIFTTPRFAEIILDSWRFLQKEREIDVLAFVLIENHIHWIAVGPELGKRVGEFKSFTATSILREMKERKYETLLQELKFHKLRHKTDQTRQLWQEGSHPQSIETEQVMWQLSMSTTIRCDEVMSTTLCIGVIRVLDVTQVSLVCWRCVRIGDEWVLSGARREPRGQCVPRQSLGTRFKSVR